MGHLTILGYGRLCIVGGGLRLDVQRFHLLRTPAYKQSLSLVGWALLVVF